MRKLIFICALLLSCACMASAQNNRAFQKGYEGNVEYSSFAVFGKDKLGSMIQLSTTHGYRTGWGVFLGAGVGVDYDFYLSDTVLSAFLDAKYNFVDAKVSPFAEVRSGVRGYDKRIDVVQPFVSIAGGIDTGRFSVKLGYDYSNIAVDVYDSSSYGGNYVGTAYRKPSQLFCSFAFKF